MLPIIPKPPITPRQKAAALVVAGIVDFLQLTLIPALEIGYILDDILDFIAAIALMAICGFKWQFILAFFLELTPFVDLFPTWTAVALLLPTQQPRQNAPPAPPVSPSTTQPPSPARRPEIEVQAVVIPPVVKPKTEPTP